MPAQLNRVCVTGNLTRDPELRHTAGGDPICGMRIAVTSRTRDGDGWKDKANYLNVTVFGRQAQTCADYLGKGREITVDGRLDYREWEKDGDRRSSVGIIANDVIFGRAPVDGEGAGAPVVRGPVEDKRPDMPVERPAEPVTDDDFDDIFGKGE